MRRTVTQRHKESERGRERERVRRHRTEKGRDSYMKGEGESDG